METRIVSTCAVLALVASLTGGCARPNYSYQNPPPPYQGGGGAAPAQNPLADFYRDWMVGENQRMGQMQQQMQQQQQQTLQQHQQMQQQQRQQRCQWNGPQWVCTTF